MPSVLRADLALDVRAELGEGPVWDSESSELVWVDLVAGRVHRFSPGRATDSAQDFGVPVGAAGLRATGGLVLALADHFALSESDGRFAAVSGFSVDRAEVRFNDGKVGPDGAFYAGTLDWEETDPIGSLFRLDPSGTVSELVAGVTVSNGLDWAPDGSAMYYVDSPTRCVRQFSPLEGQERALTERGPAIEVAPPGLPDGLTVDSDGCIWVALWGGWQVRRYRPDGTLLAVVEVPVAHVSSVAFGGEHLDELYITTARFGRAQRQLLDEPHAGSVFCCRPGASGLPAYRFAG